MKLEELLLILNPKVLLEVQYGHEELARLHVENYKTNDTVKKLLNRPVYYLDTVIVVNSLGTMQMKYLVLIGGNNE